MELALPNKPASCIPSIDCITNFSACLSSDSYVRISPTLCDCLLEKSEYQEVESLKWDDLFSR